MGSGENIPDERGNGSSSWRGRCSSRRLRGIGFMAGVISYEEYSGRYEGVVGVSNTLAGSLLSEVEIQLFGCSFL